MSTRLLYHGFGIRGYRYVSSQFAKDRITFRIAQEMKNCRCAKCGATDVAPRGHVERLFRSLPLGGRPVSILLPIPRVQCRSCNLIRQVPLDFAEPRRSYTKAFARYVLELSRLMTIQDVANHLDISWDIVKDIVKEDLQRRFDRPKLKHLRQIAIDEICIGAGHRYVTLVLDLASGAVVHFGKGKGADALEPFWKRLRSSGAKVEAVATDMSAAYIKAVRRGLPRATLVFDRFHVMKLFNDKLSQLRRQLYHEATEARQRVLKGVRWLLLKRPENLDAERGETERLEAALQLNAPLATAYYLKEELAEFWEQDDEREAEAYLLDWLARAEASGIKIVEGLAATLRDHALGLMAYYDYPISTGPLEGTNNKIKTLQRQAYGYKDQAFFRLKVLACHQAKYALIG